METIPLAELFRLVEDIHSKTREALKNSDIDMREFLGIDKALQIIQGEVLNNTWKLTEINKRMEKDTKNLKEVENDPTYSDEKRQLYKDRLDDLNTEKQVSLEILSQNRKDLQTQVARIKQTLEKALGKNSSLQEKIREQIVTIISILTAVLTSISTIVLSITGDFEGRGGSAPKDEAALNKWLNRPADTLKRLAGKALESLPAVVGSVVGAVSSFLGKTVGFVAEQTWALILFVAGLIDVRLMQKVKK